MFCKSEDYADVKQFHKCVSSLTVHICCTGEEYADVKPLEITQYISKSDKNILTTSLWHVLESDLINLDHNHIHLVFKGEWID